MRIGRRDGKRRIRRVVLQTVDVNGTLTLARKTRTANVGETPTIVDGIEQRAFATNSKHFVAGHASRRVFGAFSVSAAGDGALLMFDAAEAAETAGKGRTNGKESPTRRVQRGKRHQRKTRSKGMSGRWDRCRQAVPFGQTAKS